MLAQLRTWLIANVADLAGGNVHVDQAEQGTTGTHVVISRIDEDPSNHLGGRGGLNAAEIDIDCKAATPDEAEALANAVIDALEPHTGAMGSVTVKAVILTDTRDWFESAKPGRNVDQYVTTHETMIQYSRS